MFFLWKYRSPESARTVSDGVPFRVSCVPVNSMLVTGGGDFFAGTPGSGIFALPGSRAPFGPWDESTLRLGDAAALAFFFPATVAPS